MGAAVPRTSIVAFFLLALSAAAVAQDYPNRPVTILVPQAPGASSDLVARTLAERLQPLWGQSVVVDNRPGAGGNVGAAIAARAAPDGYTLMIGTDAMMTSNVHLYRNMPFDPIKDFAPVAMAGANIICLAVHESTPVKTVPELIAYAKANPGKLKYGTPGAASPHHLAGELLALKAGIEIEQVPYRGGGPAANDLLGGHIPMAFISLSSAVPLLPSGKIRVVALIDKSRYVAMPDVPTIGETIPGFEMSSWLGVFAPAATPAPLVARIGDTMTRIFNDPQVKEKLATLGQVVGSITRSELAAMIKRDTEVRAALIKAANIQPQ
ncbi:MAG: tripartite tricarboxylate transporter substrate binding protein [Xanthobacteraceae bacterium]|nr:tripartite tricarboxylate transporter substrate binding protein [Xanthobacteraceae bacterium]